MKITKILLIAFLVFLWTLPAFAQNNSKRIFIVASYEENHICGGPQEEGSIKGFSKEGWFEGMNLEIKRFYMNTKRKHTTPKAMQAQADIALKQIEAFRPDVVLTIDDNAFRLVGLALAGKKDVSVVFSGLNGQPEKYNTKNHFMENRKTPGSNITGVYEKLYVARSIKVMTSAVAGLKGNKIIGITDYSPTGNALTKQFELELATPPRDVTWEIRRVKNWQEYTKLIKSINQDDSVKAIYPVALALKVTDSLTYTAPEIFKWTTENCKKPGMALNYFFSKVGLFGGAAVDFKAMGFQAGKMAGEILNGVKAGDIAIEDAHDYAIVFNLKRANQLKIEIPAPLLTAADYVYK